jgi:Lon protease-like protein
MSAYLPLFPLSLVVFPGEKLNLHIFEPRYKQLVHECVAEGKNFGIPAFIKNAVGQFGTEIEILGIEKKYENGEMDIRTKGLRVIHISQFDRMAPGKLYPGGEVTYLPNKQDEDVLIKAQLSEIISKLYDALGIKALYMALPENFKSYDIGHHIGLTTEQEYALLQVQSEAERQEMILQHLQLVLPIVLETERLKERVKLNGHFKHLSPPDF